MKVRIGGSLGQGGVPDQFSAAVDALEAAGAGSLWLPEMVCGSLAGPFTDGAWSAASRSLSGLGGHLPSRAARIVWAAFILEKLPGHVRGHHGRRDGLLDSLLQSRQL